MEDIEEPKDNNKKPPRVGLTRSTSCNEPIVDRQQHRSAAVYWPNDEERIFYVNERAPGEDRCCPELPGDDEMDQLQRYRHSLYSLCPQERHRSISMYSFGQLDAKQLKSQQHHHHRHMTSPLRTTTTTTDVVERGVPRRCSVHSNRSRKGSSARPTSLGIYITILKYIVYVYIGKMRTLVKGETFIYECAEVE